MLAYWAPSYVINIVLPYKRTPIDGNIISKSIWPLFALLYDYWFIMPKRGSSHCYYIFWLFLAWNAIQLKVKKTKTKQKITSGVSAPIQGLNLVPQTFNKFITIIVSVAVAFGRWISLCSSCSLFLFSLILVSVAFHRCFSNCFVRLKCEIIIIFLRQQWNVIGLLRERGP